jgi:hypothetical protein
VLPLLRDELRVVLAPEQVVMMRLAWSLTKRGPAWRIAAKIAVDCSPAADGETPWAAAIKTVETGLPQLLARKTVAKVILSNHFMRYTLVPWSETLSDAAEDEAYARHCFRQLYGADAEQWELRLCPQRAGLPQLASAVDKRLLAALRGVFSDHGVVLKSIQPRLMAAYNNSRFTLQKQSAWFVLYEPGYLCLALLQHGYWVRVRTMRVGSDWRDTLALLIEREVYLAESSADTKMVFLWAPELEIGTITESGRWQIHNLQPVLHPALAAEYEGRFGMALSG